MAFFKVFEHFSQGIAVFFAHCIALIGILIIAHAALKSIYLFYQGYKGTSVNINQIRLEFGYSLILALEFMVGADIIESIGRPTFYDLGLLACVVLIRTFLSYFLNKELEALTPEKRAKVEDISK